MSEESAEVKPATEAPELDPSEVAYLQQQLHSEQNLALGTAAGVVASFAGAGIWAAVTFATGYQIGFMAVGVGFLVGYAIRFAGKGTTTIFGIIGASLALIGCALGNLLAITAQLANHSSIPFLDALHQLDPQLIQELMVAFFSPMDLVFYGIAIYEGFRLSFRQLTTEELKHMLSGGVQP